MISPTDKQTQIIGKTINADKHIQIIGKQLLIMWYEIILAFSQWYIYVFLPNKDYDGPDGIIDTAPMWATIHGSLISGSLNYILHLLQANNAVPTTH
jgi:hypothetical protein